MLKTYRVRKFQNGKNKDGEPFINYSLTIPSPIAEKLPANMQYACELTDEGILFKPAEDAVEEVKLPTWAKQNGDSTMSSAKTKSQLRAESGGQPAKKRARPKKDEPKTEDEPAPA